MKYYYTNPQNQPVGPVELSELTRLAAQGTINDQTAVIPEGSQTWSNWGALKNGIPAAQVAAAPVPADHSGIATILGDTVAGILVRLAGWLSPALLQNSLKFAGRYGHFAVLAGAGLGLILAVVLASRMHSFTIFAIAGIGFVLVVAVAQFSAQRFMSAGAMLIASTPNRLSSKSFLECVGLFAILGAVGSLLSGLVASIHADSLLPLVPSILIGAYLLYFAMTALHPEELNVTISGEASAGEEAISLLAYFSKVGLKLAPLFFFLLAVVGAIFILLTMFNVGEGASQALLGMLPLPPLFGSVAQYSPGQMLVLVACLVPVLSYFFFLLSYLTIDLLRAVLCIPGKLDALRKA